MNAKQSILIVGGYGAVGRVIAETLAQHSTHSLIIAGRNQQKGAKFVQTLGTKHRSIILDIAQPGIVLPEDVALIINCIDHSNSAWVEQSLRRGIHYIDISASYSQIQAIGKMDALAKKHQSTAVLSVGLAPGITNLLAKLCKINQPDTYMIDIYIMLGLGEAHGDAAIRWVFDQLIESDSFEEERSIHVPSEAKSRTAYNFGFPEQYTLPQTLNLAQAKTWLSADPNWVGKALQIFKRLKLSGLLCNKRVMDTMIHLSNKFPIGSDTYAITVQGINQLGEIVTREMINGQHEAVGTGVVTAIVATHILEESYPYGVFHSEQLFEPIPFIKELMDLEPSFHYRRRMA